MTVPPKMPAFKPSSLAEWKTRSRMEVTLPSGANAVLRTLTLDELAGKEALPEDLLHAAWLEQLPGGAAAHIAGLYEKGDKAALRKAQEIVEARRDLRDRLVLASVVSPRLTAKDLPQIDPADREMIADLAQRRQNVDAAGRRIGADRLDSFRSVCEVLARSESDQTRRALLLELAAI
jgi:hypothetical protein